MAAGLQPPPPHAPRRLRRNADLRSLQRLMTHTLVQPLTGSDDRLPERWRDGRSMAEVAGEFIKPNDRLSAVERLQIYARCYWYRLIECAYDDCPGLRALLGERKFSRLIRAYLAKHPSQSYSLRALCERLPQFLEAEPQWAAPRSELAIAVARFEWAQTVAFDAASLPPVTPADLAGPATRLRLALQPHLSLLDLHWPIDDFIIAVKKRDALRADASNAIGTQRRRVVTRSLRPPRRQRTCIVVHRHQNRLYYKRVPAAAFSILVALQRGRTLPQAIAAGGSTVTAELVRDWFTTWTELGWLCQRPRHRK